MRPNSYLLWRGVYGKIRTDLAKNLLGGFCCARELKEYIRLISHDPRIVSGLDDCEVTRAKL